MWSMNEKLCLKSISKSATNMDFPGSASKNSNGEKKKEIVKVKRKRKEKKNGKNCKSLG